MRKLKGYFLMSALAVPLSACVGDRQVDVRANVKTSSECSLRKLTAGKVVAEYKIEGEFRDSFAVPLGSDEDRTIEVVCNGKVLLTKDITQGENVIDLGEL